VPDIPALFFELLIRETNHTMWSGNHYFIMATKEMTTIKSAASIPFRRY